MAQLTVDISDEMHRQFKAKCAHWGYSMVDVARASVAAFLAEGDIDFHALGDACGVSGWLATYERQAGEGECKRCHRYTDIDADGVCDECCAVAVEVREADE